MRRRDFVHGAAAVCLAEIAVSCGEHRSVARQASRRLSPSAPPSTDPQLAPTLRRPPPYAVDRPGSLHGDLRTADVLVTSGSTLPERLSRQLGDLPGVVAVVPCGISAASVSGRTLVLASASPSSFRRFTPFASAYANAVWDRVAGGEVALDPSVGPRVEQPSGFLTLGQGARARSVHIGAYAPLPTGIQAVVNELRGREMRIPHQNALLVSTGEADPVRVSRDIARMVPHQATCQVLATKFAGPAVTTAVLAGGSVTRAVGSFHYVANPDGTIRPNARWVSRYIHTETMPIIGRVTGNRGMLPQLRAALDEIVSLGLSSRIHPSQYGGCYVPRYIAYEPRLGLSLHSWGIAVDLNVPENLRGTRGHMDPQIVETFSRWGFDWGGNWHYTDPMHFEMSSLIRSH